MSATNMVREDRLDVDPKVWTHQRTELIRTAAEDPDVERIFVNAAIKKALCREAGSDRAWLAKVRPWWGHDYHFHVRIVLSARQPAVQAATASRRRAKAAAMSSISGSRQACCIRRRRRSRRSRDRR